MRSEKQRHQLWNTVFGLAILSSLQAWPALAKTTPSTTIQVTNTNDSGPGSLRDAISSASSGDTITFSLPSYPATITPSSVLSINSSLTINGPGDAKLSISGKDSGQILQIPSGVTVAISGVTITGSSTYPDDYGSGVIFSSGTLTLTNSTVSGNFAHSGIASSGTLTLTNSTVSNNCCFAGGIYSYSGSVTLINSTVSGNTNLSSGGGGITGGQVTLINSTVSGNTADIGAGGIMGGQVTLINSTVSGNSAGFAGPGGIWGSSGTLINSTISGNRGFLFPSGGVFGGIFGVFTLKNTILANNTDYFDGSLHRNCAGSVSSYGHNLSDDNSCSLSGPADLNNTPAGLDPSGLKNNGGPTQTIALLPTSQAIDAIPSNYCTAIDGTPIATDQRGIPRPQGLACDIGAFEYLAITGPAPTSGSTCNGAYNGTFNGNLTISPGQNCIFFNGEVTGNVQQYGGTIALFQSKVGGDMQVKGGGTFTVGPGSTIDGNLQIQNLPSGSVPNQVCGTIVGGDLQFQNNGTAVLIGGYPPSPCNGNTVRGNLHVQNNWAATTIVGNTVSGNLMDQNNTGLTQVFNNTVSGNLHCQNDTTIQGGGNTVAQQKQGQCSAF